MSKIFVETDVNANFKANLKVLYKHFFNFLPSFFGYSFKGVALIGGMKKADVNKAFELGVELGFFYQFGIFTYIISGVQRRENKEMIKTKLSQLSTICQYVSLETIEKILYKMRMLKLGVVKEEFAMLTYFHGQKFL